MAIVNITVENDADFYRQFLYQTLEGAPIDLTGSTLKMGVRKRAEDTVEEMLLTTENGSLAIVNAAGGAFTVLITKQKLVELPVGDYEHSLIRIYSGMHLRIWSGMLTNNAGPSR